MTIEQIQHLLAFLGFDPGPCDGIDGPQTQAAVKAFQHWVGLTQDGKAGPDTQEVLRNCVQIGLPPQEDVPESGTFWDDIKHFARAEFACKCGQYHDPYCDGYPAEMREEVVRICDEAREHFGRPGHIISGLRCPQHNADSGGVANSQHMYGEACDLMIEGVSAGELLAWIQSRPGVRYAYAINGTNVHFDIPAGKR